MIREKCEIGLFNASKNLYKGEICPSIQKLQCIRRYISQGVDFETIECTEYRLRVVPKL